MIPTRFNRLGINALSSQVEYFDGTYYYDEICGIEFVSGISYFDTGINPTLTTRAICVAKMANLDEPIMLFGSRMGSTQDTNSFALLINITPNLTRLDWGIRTNNPVEIGVNKNIFNEYRIEPGPGNGLFVNDIKKITIPSNANTLNNSRNIFLGAINSNGDALYGFIGTMKLLQIYSAGSTLRGNFVPVKRQNVDVFGFFNTINNTFLEKLGSGIIAPVYS